MNGYNRMQAEVTDLARDNFNQYSDDYPLDEVFPDFVNQGAKGSYLVASEEALNNAEALAISYYENRSELDVERDDEAGVVVLDYIEAVRCALIDWIQNK